MGGDREALREAVRAIVIVELAGGCAYETQVIRAIRKAGAAGRIRRGACADSTLPDADIRVNGRIYPIEVKADSHAQMGGGSVRYSVARRRFSCGSSCSDMSAAAVEMLEASEDSAALKDALDGLVAFLAPRTRSRELTEFPLNGIRPRDWQAAVRRGLVAAVNRYMNADPTAVEAHYAAKGTHYIQIGGAGLFRLGEADPAGFGVPRLAGRARLEFRAVSAGGLGKATTSVSLRVQARLAGVGRSSSTLDDPESVRALLDRVQGEERTF